MISRLIALTLAVAAPLALPHAQASAAAAESGPVADVTGGKVRGAALAGGGAVFLGIPYARPPVGPLRWREPSPVEPWTGIRDAVAYGAPCAQNPYFGPGLAATAPWPSFDPTSRAYVAFTDKGAVAKQGLRRPFCDLFLESAIP